MANHAFQNHEEARAAQKAAAEAYERACAAKKEKENTK